MLKQINHMQKVAVYLGIVIFLEFMLLMLPIKLNTFFFMFVPFVSVLITMLLTGEAFSKKGWSQLGFHRFSTKFFAIGLLVPMLPILIGFSFVWLSGLGTFGVAPEYEGKAIFLTVQFVISFLFSSLTVTLGEEIGWRGYMEAKLSRLGLAPSLLLNGFIWGLFHLPVMIFTDIYHDGVNLFVYIPMFMVTVTLAGAFMTYLKTATGSIWPAIAAHSMHNLVWNYGDLLTQNPKPIVTYLTGDAGIVLILFYLIVFVIIVKRDNTAIHSAGNIIAK
jgi:uncharacterized protein